MPVKYPSIMLSNIEKNLNEKRFNIWRMRIFTFWYSATIILRKGGHHRVALLSYIVAVAFLVSTSIYIC